MVVTVASEKNQFKANLPALINYIKNAKINSFLICANCQPPAEATQKIAETGCGPWSLSATFLLTPHQSLTLIFGKSLKDVPQY